MPAIQLTSSAGSLAGLHDAPEGPPRAGLPRAAVVCHPHPVHGGRMDNKVVHTVAKVLRERGLHVVRFNFRGFGGSEGEHDQGRGELDDVRAAIDFAAGLVRPQDELLVCGYSFGSYVGLRAALDDERVSALLAIAPPVNHYDFEAVGRTSRPLAVVYSKDDELVPADAVEAWLAACATPPRVSLVDGGGHLFHGRLGPIREAVGSFLDALEVESGRDAPRA